MCEAGVVSRWTRASRRSRVLASSHTRERVGRADAQSYEWLDATQLGDGRLVARRPSRATRAPTPTAPAPSALLALAVSEHHGVWQRVRGAKGRAGHRRFRAATTAVCTRMLVRAHKEPGCSPCLQVPR